MPKLTSNRVKRKLRVHGPAWWCCDRWFGSPNVKCPVCGAKPTGIRISEIRRIKEFL